MEADLDIDRLIRLRQVETIAGIKRSRLYELIAKGAFPPPAKIGAASRFSHSEVCAWRDAQRAMRRASDTLASAAT